MENEMSKAQENRIKAEYDFIKDEQIVTSKDAAFYWILEIGKNYDGQNDTKGLISLIDEMMAYAQAGKECIE